MTTSPRLARFWHPQCLAPFVLFRGGNIRVHQSSKPDQTEPNRTKPHQTRPFLKIFLRADQFGNNFALGLNTHLPW